MLAALLCTTGSALTAATAIAGDPSAPAGVRATTAASDVVLKRGDRGPAVETLQHALGIGADGVFGKLTARAVREYQRGKGLTVDGVVGPQTRAALGLRPFSSRSVTRRSVARSVPVPRVLRRIAACESGGNPRAISPGGTYRGKYQFHRDTWKGLGGTGDPAAAPESVQDRLALKLYRQQGSAPWPSCGV